MAFLKNLSVKTKLAALAPTTFAGIAIFGVAAFDTIKVDGPLFEKRKVGNDVNADTLAPLFSLPSTLSFGHGACDGSGKPEGNKT
jgi:hypothetical protein